MKPKNGVRSGRKLRRSPATCRGIEWRRGTWHRVLAEDGGCGSFRDRRLPEAPAHRRFVMQGILFSAAALSVLVTVGIVYVLVSESVKFFAQVSIIDFLFDTQWTPVFENPRFGIITLISGTLMSSSDRAAVADAARNHLGDLSVGIREFARARDHQAVPGAARRRSHRRFRLFRAAVSHTALPRYFSPISPASICSCRASLWAS